MFFEFKILQCKGKQRKEQCSSCITAVFDAVHLCICRRISNVKAPCYKFSIGLIKDDCVNFSGTALIFSNQFFSLCTISTFRCTAGCDCSIHVHIGKDCTECCRMQSCFLGRTDTVFAIGSSADSVLFVEGFRKCAFPAPVLE